MGWFLVMGSTWCNSARRSQAIYEEKEVPVLERHQCRVESITESQDKPFGGLTWEGCANSGSEGTCHQPRALQVVGSAPHPDAPRVAHILLPCTARPSAPMIRWEFATGKLESWECCLQPQE